MQKEPRSRALTFRARPLMHEFSAGDVAQSYEEMAEAERAFRAMKSDNLESRPIHHRLEYCVSRTTGNQFVPPTLQVHARCADCTSRHQSTDRSFGALRLSGCLRPCQVSKDVASDDLWVRSR